MPYVIVRHNVDDYEKWKPRFDEHKDRTNGFGSTGGQVLRSRDEPNEVVVMVEWADMDKARQFFQSEELKQAMKDNGVVGKPDLYFLDEVDRFSA